MAYFRYSRVGQTEDIPLTGTTEEDDSKDIKRSMQRRASLRMVFISLGLGVSVLLNIYLLISAALHNSLTDGPYSPAAKVLRQTEVVFSSGFGIQQCPFQGKPSETNNKLWESLYNFGISRVSADEARRMPNKTLPIPGDNGGYVPQLSAFHLLHCLNRVRQGLWGAVDMSNQDDSLGIEHLDHCVDHIRQHVMCCGDVTALTFARQSRNDTLY